MVVENLPPVYDPRQVEPKWYRYWEENGFFHAEVNPVQEPFCIVMPPPNVTGSLHLGHALDNTLQDILVRWRRMQGYNVLWVPGTDHAGIATQARVEEELARAGELRFDLGREEFVARVWDWKNRYGSRITQQLRLLGASCDWQRERFTMDEGCSQAVREVFVQFYEKGLIYRGDYLVNWCPRCHTVISDIEVEHEPEEGHLWHIRYPLAGEAGFIEVATTRPETMLGDTAVAVHPEDDRYRHLVGKKVILPLAGRPIPIVADPYVDPGFGTGAVKITPAHDPNDFEVARRHELPMLQVIDREGRMTEEAGKYAGLDRQAARQAVVADLASQGYLVRTDDYQHVVGHCYRCGTIIEPLVSRQWFVRMEPLAGPARQVVQEGRIRFIPEHFSHVYLEWLDHIRDWCISRQLWWGHRIPVWYCQQCGEIIVSRTPPEKCPQCASRELEQDPDVLDTWFSSGLWPFSALGWPQSTPELHHFYPTSVLVTGRDIIFFWVARMIFLSLAFMGEPPFREVFIHGLIRDAQGRKMSKSLGNGVDPVAVIQEYGADPLRFMLITGNTPGNDLRFNMEKVEGARNFANKIWNAARFVLMNLEDCPRLPEQPPVELADRWILSRLNEVTAAVTANLEAYEIGEAARVLCDFIWDEFCDWYVEIAKVRLYGESPEERAAAQGVLYRVLSQTLQLLHPFMPFLTEEIWQKLPGERSSIMIANWPAPRPDLVFPQEVENMNRVMEVVRGLRNVRRTMHIPPSKKLRVLAAGGEAMGKDVLEGAAGYIQRLANVQEIGWLGRGEDAPPLAATVVAGGFQLFVPLGGLINLEEEIERLDRELQEVEKQLAGVRRKLASSDFLNRAPAEVIAAQQVRERECLARQEALTSRLQLLKGE